LIKASTLTKEEHYGMTDKALLPMWVVIKIEYRRFFGVSKVPIFLKNRNF
jgi:hypothetical protein